MDFVDPDQYTKSNEAHFNINRRAVNDYVKIYSCFGSQERYRNFGQYNLMKNFLKSILDFGCGTGETTAAMANGAMGQLGSPAEVNK